MVNDPSRMSSTIPADVYVKKLGSGLSTGLKNFYVRSRIMDMSFLQSPRDYSQRGQVAIGDNFAHPLVPREGKACRVLVVFCPNPDCRKFALAVELLGIPDGGGSWGLLRRWRLMPESDAKSFPDYIPAPILADYREACLIADLSPKASATLSPQMLARNDSRLLGN